MDDMLPRTATYLGDDDGHISGGLVAWILGAIVVELFGLVALIAFLF